MSFLCNSFTVLLWLLLSQPALAHHTKDHMMLAEDAGQVVAATRESDGGALGWLLWVLLAVALLSGLIRWWRQRT